MSPMQDAEHHVAWSDSRDLNDRRQDTKRLSNHQPILDWGAEASFGIYRGNLAIVVFAH